jgi:drug/metabolite transporter (DMT)-like permease
LPNSRTIVLTCLALLAFAGNSLLARVALQRTGIDPASYASLRLIAGAFMLLLITRATGRLGMAGDWWSAFALFVYAAGFAFAYQSLSTGTGALLLFGAVQITMIGYGIWRGERLGNRQWLGLGLALAGLVGFLLPGLAAPPFSAAALMLAAGVAWGGYSLRGRGARDPMLVTFGNFARAVGFTILLSLVFLNKISFDNSGMWYAIVSGGLTSAIGYAIWYAALPSLKATTAATLQLSVPVLAASSGIVFLGEALNLRLVLASVVILGGIALVIFENKPHRASI